MNSKNNQVHFHLWIPDIFQFKGGIQVYSAFFLKALQNIEPNAAYDVFLKNDTHYLDFVSCLPTTKFHFSGKIPQSLRTLFYSLQLFISAFIDRPNLIISTHPNFIIVAYWLKKCFKIPYWTVTHGVEAWNITNPLLKRALQEADLILSVSNYTRERLLKEQNLDSDRIVILPNTFDPEQFKIAPKPNYLLEKYHLLPDQPIILTVARLAALERYKGYDQIIQVFPKIKTVIPDIHYILVGKGADRTRLKKLIIDLNLEDNITLTGFIADEELNNYYNLCDVFAMPSKKEGFGIVYLEALACGKPVLGGNQDGAIDALCNGELGALVDPDNLDEITETLIEILRGNYPNQIMYQPEALRQKVIETFGFKKFKQTLEIYLQKELI
jgi:glycosyltransferase involved in cell wall biosynthesis